MDLFNLLFTRPVTVDYGQVYRLRMRDINVDELSLWKVGDKVNFWSKSHLPEVSIYPSKSFGGGPALGYVPRKFREAIRKHILQKRQYKAIIFDASGTIEFTLYE